MSTTEKQPTDADSAYHDTVKYFNGHPITIRYYPADGLALIKTDDHFAQANGFNSIKELQALVPGSERYEWINAEDLAEAFKYQRQLRQSNNSLIN